MATLAAAVLCIAEAVFAVQCAMTMPTKPAAAAPVPERPAPAGGVARAFGRFVLRQLLGKSERSMVWLAHDPRVSQDVMLTLPRLQPVDEAALESWQREVGAGARLNHPQLAAPSEVGVQDHWPYVVVDRAYGMTFGEWLDAHPGAPVAELVACICQALEGLAFAHEAGSAHGDLQFHSLVLSENGTVRVMALGTAGEPALSAVGKAASGAHQRAMAVGTSDLRAQRERAERDVLAFGLMLFRLLAGQSPLDESDVSAVVLRLPPLGREIVRLPWSTPKPVPEALRAIVNRATSAQERQRYLNARTLLRALNGWREVEGSDNGGPLALLLDRLRTVGHLPAMPGAGRRIAKLAAAEGQRTDELAREILQDMALSFEMLRLVNSSLLQGSHGSGGGVVITVRRAVALMGLDGIRRASTALRTWPGPLSEGAAANLQRVIDRVRLAGHAAQALRPAGYDAEVIYLVVMLQNLGRLLINYHFPEEAEQIQQLMRSTAPPPGSEPGTVELPGLSETGASLAVLGVDVDAVGAAVAKYWGLGDEVQLMMRRIPKERPVRTVDGDADLLRTVASAANEVVDALDLADPKRLGSVLAAVAQRYARVLGIDARGVKDALDAARMAMREGNMPQAGGPGASADTGPVRTEVAAEKMG